MKIATGMLNDVGSAINGMREQIDKIVSDTPSIIFSSLFWKGKKYACVNKARKFNQLKSIFWRYFFFSFIFFTCLCVVLDTNTYTVTSTILRKSTTSSHQK